MRGSVGACFRGASRWHGARFWRAGQLGVEERSLGRPLSHELGPPRVRSFWRGRVTGCRAGALPLEGCHRQRPGRVGDAHEVRRRSAPGVSRVELPAPLRSQVLIARSRPVGLRGEGGRFSANPSWGGLERTSCRRWRVTMLELGRGWWGQLWRRRGRRLRSRVLCSCALIDVPRSDPGCSVRPDLPEACLSLPRRLSLPRPPARSPPKSALRVASLCLSALARGCLYLSPCSSPFPTSAHGGMRHVGLMPYRCCRGTTHVCHTVIRSPLLRKLAGRLTARRQRLFHCETPVLGSRRGGRLVVHVSRSQHRGTYPFPLLRGAGMCYRPPLFLLGHRACSFPSPSSLDGIHFPRLVELPASCSWSRQQRRFDGK